jgi:predicted alpha/beta-hydrolase family hydrolase
MVVRSESIEFLATVEHGTVSAILDRPESTHSLMVLGHGSGSTMRVPFIGGLSAALVAAGVATFRFEYPYSEHPDFVPYTDMPMDEPDVLVATIRAAAATAAGVAPDVPLFVGGHSVSGLMTSVANAESPLPSVRGVIMLGFPLKGDMERAAHLGTGATPLLFLQGTADSLGDADQIQQVVDSIGARATLRFIDSASHGFAVPDRPDHDVYSEMARYIAAWTTSVVLQQPNNTI